MKRWVKTVFLQLDVLVNSLFGGYSGETISHRLALMGRKGYVAGCVFCYLIQKILPGHCDLKKPSKAQQLARPGDNPLADGV